MKYLSRLILILILPGCMVDFARDNDVDTDSGKDTASENEAGTCTYACMPETTCKNDFGGLIRGELTCADENEICCEPTQEADTGSDRVQDTGSDRGIDTDPATLADTGSGADADTHSSDSVVDTGSDTVVDTESESGHDTGSETNSGTHLDTGSGTALDTGSDTTADTESETQAGTESETNSGTQADTGSDTVIDTASETQADTESETDSGTHADTGSDTVIDTASETQADTDSTTAQDRSIEDIVAQTYVLQNFEALLVMTGVFEDMQSPPYTLFAPWDYALDNLPYWEEMTADSAWWGHLRDLVLGHITNENLPYEELANNMAVTMLNGDVALITVENDRPRVDGFRFIGNTPASDGYFYLLQDVREPKWATRTVLDIIDSEERFSILAQILNQPSMIAKRKELSATESRLTFFAPTNEALAGFNIEDCTGSDCLGALGLLVEKHLVDRLAPKLFTPSQGFVTQAGSSLNWYFSTKLITCTNEDQTRQEVELDAADEEFALNGIVYPIDTLLCATINQ